MNAPLGRTPETGTRCQCWDRDCGARGDTFHPRGKHNQCGRDAVRLVTVPKPNTGRSLPHFIPVELRLCEPCAQHHEAAHTAERLRNPLPPCPDCDGNDDGHENECPRASHTEKKGGPA